MTFNAHTASTTRLASVLRKAKSPEDELVTAALEIGRRDVTDPKVGSRLRDLLGHRSADVREAAAEALGRLRVALAVPVLSRLVADRAQPTEVRDTCAYALGLIEDVRALRALVQVLREPGVPETLHKCARFAQESIVTRAAAGHAISQNARRRFHTRRRSASMP